MDEGVGDGCGLDRGNKDEGRGRGGAASAWIDDD